MALRNSKDFSRLVLDGHETNKAISDFMKRVEDLQKTLAITLVFNTVIALVLTLMVVKEERFLTVFVISQLTGLSICLFVQAGIFISEENLKKWMGGCIAAGLILGILAGGLLNWGFLALFHGMSLNTYYTRVFAYIAVFGVVFGVPILYFFISREKLAESEAMIQNEKIKRLSMEKEAAITSLRLLQAQIEPHFLFNTLSNVISLLDIDVGKAKKMLIDVNTYLRISLQRTRQEMITLSQELDLVRRYLEIYKIRMGKRLSYTINDETGRPGLSFPPLIVQPLVENAIKYGLEPKIDGGEIVIRCRIEGQILEIVIADNGCGLDDNTYQAGVGIDNVSQRLESIYGSRADLELVPNQPQGLQCIIKVPL